VNHEGTGVPHAISDEFREQVIAPFLSAVTATLEEMAQTSPGVREVYASASFRPLGDVMVLIKLRPEPEGLLVLGMPGRTASVLANRVLSQPDEGLIRDCVGEFANVIAGQAKTLLGESPYHFTFSTPTIMTGPEFEAIANSLGECSVISFACDAGDFTLQLRLTR
jgi:chemotaxis protein CheX